MNIDEGGGGLGLYGGQSHVEGGERSREERALVRERERSNRLEEGRE